VPGVWRPDNRMSWDGARSVSRQLSHRPRVPARGAKVGHVFANEASPLQVRRLRHTRKTTSPNAARCPKCGKAWEKERNRQNQRRRYQRLTAARRAG
jgi:hypothetical protein